ncbi:alpha-hydroxy-acid oxidizing protein [Rhodococcus sp. NPDC003322]
MAVAGDRGVEHVLTILRSEIERGMTLLGVRDIRDLNRSRARAATGRNENEILMVPSSIQ